MKYIGIIGEILPRLRINRSTEAQDGPAPLVATSTRRRVVSGYIPSGLILRELTAED
jgi:hypothetical protein